MNTHAVWIVPFLLFATGALAQQPTTTASKAAWESCLLGTSDEVWAKLKLTSDQLRRMHFVQEACKEECSDAGAKRPANSISHADGSTILTEVASILSGDQHRAWLAYCADHKADALPVK